MLWATREVAVKVVRHQPGSFGLVDARWAPHEQDDEMSALLLLPHLAGEERTDKRASLVGVLLLLGGVCALVGGVMYVRSRLARAASRGTMSRMERRINAFSVRIPLWTAAILLVLAACVFIVGLIRGAE